MSVRECEMVPGALFRQGYSSADHVIKTFKVFKQKKGLTHAVVMLFCLSILLSLVYTQTRSHVYVEPQQAIKAAIGFDEASEISSVDDIWDWVEALTTRVGGDSVTLIENYCGPSPFIAQKIMVDGVEYEVVNPNPDFSTCSAASYVLEKESVNKVYLTGNFQILLFGILTDRSHPVHPDENSVARGYYNETISVQTEDVQDMNSLRDTRLLEVCKVEYVDGPPTSGPTHCVNGDAFRDELGSTLQWEGKVINGVRAFDNESFATIRIEESESFGTTLPCYSFRDEDQLIPGDPSYAESFTTDDVILSDCENLWVTPGIDVFGTCTDMAGSQPQAIAAYLPASSKFKDKSLTLPEVWEELLGCTSLEGYSATEMTELSVFVGTFDPVFYKIGETSWGNFYDIQSELYFVEEAHVGLTILKGHQFVDKSTRLFGVKLLLRNVEKDGLYYSLVHCDIKITTSGGFWTHGFTMSHIPMIQYYYGVGSYEWKFREVVSLEAIALFLFLLLFLRESKQLICRGLTKWNNKSTTDLPCRVDNGASDREQDGKVAVSDQAEDEGVSFEEVNAESHHNKKTDDEGETATVIPDDAHWTADVLDWSMLAMILTGIIFRIKYINECELFHNRMLDAEKNDSYDDDLEELLDIFSDLEWLAKGYRMIIFIVTVLGLLQFLRYISFSARFAIVTNTLIESSRKLVPVMFIFLCVCITFGVLGHELYGHSLPEFRNLAESMTTISMMMLGENLGLYYDMRKVAPNQTFLYFWTFNVFVGFLLLNMVLAVIFAVYEQVNDAAFAASEKNSNLKTE